MHLAAEWMTQQSVEQRGKLLTLAVNRVELDSGFCEVSVCPWVESVSWSRYFRTNEGERERKKRTSNITVRIHAIITRALFHLKTS